MKLVDDELEVCVESYASDPGMDGQACLSVSYAEETGILLQGEGIFLVIDSKKAATLAALLHNAARLDDIDTRKRRHG